MKLLSNSLRNPRQLMVPIHEFEFANFVVRVRHLGSPRSTVSENLPRTNRPAPLTSACILRYETAINVGKHLLVAHGTPAEVAMAQEILKTTKPAELDEHVLEAAKPAAAG